MNNKHRMPQTYVRHRKTNRHALLTVDAEAVPGASSDHVKRLIWGEHDMYGDNFVTVYSALGNTADSLAGVYVDRVRVGQFSYQGNAWTQRSRQFDVTMGAHTVQLRCKGPRNEIYRLEGSR